MEYSIIATGSTGNAVLLGGDILIDCGVPFCMLRQYLRQIKLVLLTHIHGDHFNPSTIKTLHYMRPALRFCTPPWLADTLERIGVSKDAVDVARPAERCFLRYGADLCVRCGEIPHDVPNCCWHIQRGGERAFYATDCGTMDGIKARGYDLYLVEANHTQAELAARLAEKEQRGEYAYERRAAEVHLSQEQAMDWLWENAAPTSQYVLIHQHHERGQP